MGDDENSTFRISQNDHEIFVNQLLLPALTRTLDSSFTPIPESYSSAAFFGLGKTINLDSIEFNELISHMNSIVSQSPALFTMFGYFFFVTYGMGLKARFNQGCSFKVPLATLLLDWENICLENLYLDVGFNIGSPAQNKTGFWSTGEKQAFSDIINIFYGPDHSIQSFGYRHDSFCHLKTIGGFKYKPKKSNLVMMQAYSLSKSTFYARNPTSDRQGLDLEPDDLFLQSGKLTSFTVNICYMLVDMYINYNIILEQGAGSHSFDAKKILRRKNRISVYSGCLGKHDD